MDDNLFIAGFLLGYCAGSWTVILTGYLVIRICQANKPLKPTL
ncbi:hypothetical protein [Spirosoma arboris]|nr:hypothetical protein [Spirosoma arboris]